MQDDRVTVTLPLSQQGLNIVVVTAAVAVLIGVIWLILEETGKQRDAARPEKLLTALGWVLAPIWLLLLGAILVTLWQLLAHPEQGRDGFALGTGAVLVALLGAPFLIWRTVIGQTTLGYQKEGHITDRINKAVEMLGAEKEVKHQRVNSNGKRVFEKDANGEIDYARPTMVEETVRNIEVRMGAILSLERIAQDSTRFDAGRDHVRVMEILCAYIRENAQGSDATKSLRELHDEESKDPGAPTARFEEEFCNKHGLSPPDLSEAISVDATKRWARSLIEPRADVQLALTVIGRRGADQRRVEAAWPDPPTGAIAWPFDKDCPRLPDEPGEEALSKAVLDDYVKEVRAWKLDIAAYRGYRLDLRGANLQRADMAAMRPDRSDAVFAGVVLDGARMQGAFLFRARMEGAVLFRARMEGADLREARMEGADLWKARMEGVLLAGTSLRGAAARDVNWESVEISAEQVNSIFGDASVTLPGGLTPGHADWPAHWPVWELPLRDPDGDTDFRTEWRKWQADPAGYVPPPPPGD